MQTLPHRCDRWVRQLARASDARLPQASAAAARSDVDVPLSEAREGIAAEQARLFARAAGWCLAPRPAAPRSAAADDPVAGARLAALDTQLRRLRSLDPAVARQAWRKIGKLSGELLRQQDAWPPPLTHAAQPTASDAALRARLVGWRDPQQNTLLHRLGDVGADDLRAAMGHEAALLRIFAGDLSQRNADGQTPLHRLASGGQVALAQLYLAHGADADVRDRQRRTPLDLARAQQQQDYVRAFAADAPLPSCAEIGLAAAQIGSASLAAVHGAIVAQNVPAVLAMLERRPELLQRKIEHHSLVLLACTATQNFCLLRCLVERGADVCAGHARCGRTPLHAVAEDWRQPRRAYELLVQAGADPHRRWPGNALSPREQLHSPRLPL